MHGEDDLLDFQIQMVDDIHRHDKLALWAGMGLGKTICALTALKRRFDDLGLCRVLVVAPLKVALNVWPREIENWSHLQGLSYRVIHGDKRVRRYALNSPARIHIINRENIVWLFDTLKQEKFFPYDGIVVDESSSFKNFSAKRTKALMKMSFMVDFFLELTATPACNTLIDLWPQIFVLDHGERLGKTITKYREKYFDKKFHGHGYTLKKDAEDAIHKRLEDVVITLKSEDYIKLPEKMEHQVAVQFPADLRKRYEQLEAHALLELPDEKAVAGFNAGAVVGKLLQYCNGSVYYEKDLYHEVHDLKLDALEELVEQCGDETLLVAYQFRSDLERIKKRFPSAVVLDRKGSQIQAWNDGDIQMMLAHPASAGHGLNLQQGGRNIAWFGLNYSLELMAQFNGRIYRQGQDKPVQIYYITAAGTVEDDVREALTVKHLTQERLVDHLKNNMKLRAGHQVEGWL